MQQCTLARPGRKPCDKAAEPGTHFCALHRPLSTEGRRPCPFCRQLVLVSRQSRHDSVCGARRPQPSFVQAGCNAAFFVADAAAAAAAAAASAHGAESAGAAVGEGEDGEWSELAERILRLHDLHVRVLSLSAFSAAARSSVLAPAHASASASVAGSGSGSGAFSAVAAADTLKNRTEPAPNPEAQAASQAEADAEVEASQLRRFPRLRLVSDMSSYQAGLCTGKGAGADGSHRRWLKHRRQEQALAALLLESGLLGPDAGLDCAGFDTEVEAGPGAGPVVGSSDGGAVTVLDLGAGKGSLSQSLSRAAGPVSGSGSGLQFLCVDRQAYRQQAEKLVRRAPGGPGYGRGKGKGKEGDKNKPEAETVSADGSGTGAELDAEAQAEAQAEEEDEEAAADADRSAELGTGRGGHRSFRARADLADVDLGLLLRDPATTAAGALLGPRLGQHQSREQPEVEAGAGAAAGRGGCWRVTAVGKHLCGPATDCSLALLSRWSSQLRAQVEASSDKASDNSSGEGRLLGLCIATCCHSCIPDLANTAAATFLVADCGLGERQFAQLRRWAGGFSSDGSSGTEDAERVRLGRACKRLIDWGRVLWARRELGLAAVELVEFVPASVSPENVAIVGWA